eukprot:TRINITY_DN4611_c0_g1_i3.p1 TRINITY_DN4611_c0_g1~~TRINITY_DN4611_c0_g1_i3.p1  ORF type:complete len:183 (-),score=42.42 TRINITY_DN4611_c0_g1_i3:183-731(-)
MRVVYWFFFFQAEDGIRDFCLSRGLGDVYKRQTQSTWEMQIWDTAGQERFKTITQTYYKGAQGIILTYSITDRESFTHIENWMNQIRKHAGENVQQIIVGNKADLGEERQVQFSEGEALAKEHKIKFIEASAYSNYNVTELFTAIGEEILDKVIDNSSTPNDNNIALTSNQNTNISSEKSCC